MCHKPLAIGRQAGKSCLRFIVAVDMPDVGTVRLDSVYPAERLGGGKAGLEGVDAGRPPIRNRTHGLYVSTWRVNDRLTGAVSIDNGDLYDREVAVCKEAIR
jgi:hypothetical protein